MALSMPWGSCAVVLDATPATRHGSGALRGVGRFSPSNLRSNDLASSAVHLPPALLRSLGEYEAESDFSAKCSGAAVCMAYCRLEDCLCRDAAAVAAGPNVIR
jgi:hypothetical protein